MKNEAESDQVAGTGLPQDAAGGSAAGPIESERETVRAKLLAELGTAVPRVETAAGPPRVCWRAWARRLVACNPFYLVSAVLLLYAVYLVSVDPAFASREIEQLAFNFTSLQCYELLLVLTAILLGRRRLQYDSTLLVGVENVLVLVPFILVSQAALIEARTVWVLAALGAGLALARFGALKRFIAGVALPARLLQLGLVVLIANSSLPPIYRALHQNKVGTNPDWGAAFYLNEWAWFALVPALCALFLLLPAGGRAQATGRGPKWFPLTLLSLWVLGSGVHLYCLGYVYDFKLRADLLAPGIWALGWVGWRMLPKWVPSRDRFLSEMLLGLPLAAAFLGLAHPGNRVFVALMAANIGIYAAAGWLRTGNASALRFACLSAVAFAGWFPEDWGRGLIAEFTRTRCVGAALGCYALLRSMLSRDPKLGLAGAIVCGLGTGLLISSPHEVHWAWQAGAGYVLLHSLRWQDATQPGARIVRYLAAAGWVAHAWFWTRGGAGAWMPCVVAGVLVAGWLTRLAICRSWALTVVPLAALLGMASGPVQLTAREAGSLPGWGFALAGSLVLFGLGTLAALTRHRWQADQPALPGHNEDGSRPQTKLPFEIPRRLA